MCIQYNVITHVYNPVFSHVHNTHRGDRPLDRHSQTNKQLSEYRHSVTVKRHRSESTDRLTHSGITASFLGFDINLVKNCAYSKVKSQVNDRIT